MHKSTKRWSYGLERIEFRECQHVRQVCGHMYLHYVTNLKIGKVNIFKVDVSN